MCRKLKLFFNKPNWVMDGPQKFAYIYTRIIVCNKNGFQIRDAVTSYLDFILEREIIADTNTCFFFLHILAHVNILEFINYRYDATSHNRHQEKTKAVWSSHPYDPDLISFSEKNPIASLMLMEKTRTYNAIFMK